MKHKVMPEDFVVEERIRLRFTPRGPWAVYRVRKRAVTTLSVQAQMARALGVPQSDIVFPALKDKDAVALQQASREAERAIQRVNSWIPGCTRAPPDRR